MLCYPWALIGNRRVFIQFHRLYLNGAACEAFAVTFGARSCVILVQDILLLLNRKLTYMVPSHDIDWLILLLHPSFFILFSRGKGLLIIRYLLIFYFVIKVFFVPFYFGDVVAGIPTRDQSRIFHLTQGEERIWVYHRLRLFCTIPDRLLAAFVEDTIHFKVQVIDCAKRPNFAFG